MHQPDWAHSTVLSPGPELWATMLVGESPDRLFQIGLEKDHVPGGLLAYCLTDALSVPAILPGMSAYIQMAAWDGTVWGTSYSAVPPNQVGRTDTVLHVLAGTTADCRPSSRRSPALR